MIWIIGRIEVERIRKEKLRYEKIKKENNGIKRRFEYAYIYI